MDDTTAADLRDEVLAEEDTLTEYSPNASDNPIPAPEPEEQQPAAGDATAAENEAAAAEGPLEPPPSPADLLAEVALGVEPPAAEAEAEPEVVAGEEGPAAIPESPADLLAEAALGSEPTQEDVPKEQETAAAGEQKTATVGQPSLAPPKASAAPQAPAHEPIKRPEGPENSPFSILVSQVYEGPLDLLLDLIRKQDIDIYDIPIAKITAQFLAYVNRLKASDMDVAGEFIYTASLLIHIKSKMLLPREPKGGDDAQEDPRRELVERLLEHERFKNAAQMLQQKQMLEAATWTNPGAREFRTDAGAEPEIAADTTDLVRIFREILDRARSRPIYDIQEDSVTVGQMIQFLGRRLTMEDKPVALRKLLANTNSERALIAMFLALLELVRLQAILLRQNQHFSEIFIKKSSGFDAVMNEGAARDDWQ